jgi:hypothetical protein
MWLLVVVLLVALMIPITAILVDSPLGRSMARRLEGGDGDGGRDAGGGKSGSMRQLERRVEVLETDLEELNRSITGMREELQFVQRLLEDPRKQKPGS